MDDIKLQYIEKLIEKRDKIFLGGSFNLIIHSVLNTVDIYDIINYYLSMKNDNSVFYSIDSNIYKRLEHNIQNNEIFEFLVQKLEKAKYHKRQRIRKLLIFITNTLEISYRYRCFDLFYNSKYIYDKKSALLISKKIWDNSFNEMVIKDYLKLKEEFILKTYLENGDILFLLPYLEIIWKTNPRNYLKIKMIQLLCPDNFDAFKFLEKIELEKYLMAISYSNQDFSDVEIVDFYNKIDNDLKPFGLMSIGRMGKWEILEKEIEQYVF